MLRALFSAAGRMPAIKRLAVSLPWTRRMIGRFVAGETIDECLTVVNALVDQGLYVTIDFLGEDTTSATRADEVTDTYTDLLDRISESGLSDRVEVSIKLSALGSKLSKGHDVALDNAQVICARAAQAGTTVTVDMEDHTTTDATLRIVAELRGQYPWVGAVLQAMLRRTLDDCRSLNGAGSRVRLCKGAYGEPKAVAHQSGGAVDRAYCDAADILLAGAGRPMFATHDDAMIDHALAGVARNNRTADSYEIQVLHGVRSPEQLRLAAAGHVVRVYVPFGTDWYGYFMRRLAERPANVIFLLRALAERGPDQPGRPVLNRLRSRKG